MAGLVIRPESSADAEAIGEVTRTAFADVAYSDQTEPAIVEALRRAGALTVSLVAEDEGRIIGHVAVSPITVAGREVGWFGLGPVSVTPDRQGAGVGAALVREALQRLKAMGANGCVVLGDPDYYGRFGFAPDPGLTYGAAPARYFQALTLAEPAAGEVAYHSGFFAS